MNQWQRRWTSGARARRVSMLAFAIIISATVCFAQDEAGTIDKSLVPKEATEIGKFAPAGWKIEQQVTGDLNGDGVADYALTLVEAKPDKNSEGDPTERGRALVIVLARDGKFGRAGVADKLLQCTRCGGAFYGVVETPVEVTIEKGVVVVQQDHGSRNLTNTLYRFRHDPAGKQFVLIGFDYTDADRLTAKVVSESTNYSTGVRITSRDRGNRQIKTRRVIPKTTISFDGVDSGKFEEDAMKRLGLN